MSKGRKIDEQFKQCVDNHTQCRRDTLFKDIDNYKHIDLGLRCLCCDICAKTCECGKCVHNHSNFVFTAT